MDRPWSMVVERRLFVVHRAVNKNEVGLNKVVQFFDLENFERDQKYSFLTFENCQKSEFKPKTDYLYIQIAI